MPQLINGNGAQIFTAGTSVVSAPAQSATGLELATMSNLKSLLSLSAAQNTTSGTLFDFNSIPAAAKRVTLFFNGVSTNGTSVLAVQLGSGTLQTTGYVYAIGSVGTSTSIVANANAAVVQTQAALTHHGAMTFTRSTGNTWVIEANIYASAVSVAIGSGTVTLAGDLDRLRLTTGNGTDVFDAGSINILVEL